MGMRMSIETIRPQLQIRTTSGQLRVEREKEQLNIQNAWPKLTMHTTYAKVKIDQSACFADAGLKDNARLRMMFENNRTQDFFEGLSKKIADGNRLKNIVSKMPLQIPEIARENMFRNRKEFVFSQIPGVRPTIDFTEGRLDIKHQDGFARVHYVPGVVKLSYEQAKVEISATEGPKVNITWFDEKA